MHSLNSESEKNTEREGEKANLTRGHFRERNSFLFLCFCHRRHHRWLLWTKCVCAFYRIKLAHQYIIKRTPTEVKQTTSHSARHANQRQIYWWGVKENLFFPNDFCLRASLSLFHLSSFARKKSVSRNTNFVSHLTDRSMFDFGRNGARIEDTINEQRTKKASHRIT